MAFFPCLLHLCASVHAALHAAVCYASEGRGVRSCACLLWSAPPQVEEVHLAPVPDIEAEIKMRRDLEKRMGEAGGALG